MNTQLNLFPDINPQIIQTEGIKYIGSKLKLLPEILNLVSRTGARTILDGFSGSTRVSQAFAQSGYRVISNDLADWSKVFATCYLKNKMPPGYYEELISHLNSLSPEDGWFTKYYGGDVCQDGINDGIQKDGSKKPWQRKNTRKMDAIRAEIEKLNLDEVTMSIALTSLILALDRVDSTLGHYSSYLKSWSPRSFGDLELKVPRIWENMEDNIVHKADIFEVLSNLEADLAYYDPPYGSNNEKMPASRVRYASYYHIWTTVCRNDSPSLFGKALRRKDTSDRLAASVFEEFRKNDSGKFIAVDAIERLLKMTPCRWVILSYNSGGRATASELNDVICSVGKLVDLVEINHKKNIMSSMKWTNEWLRDTDEPNREFLFLIEK